MKSSMILATALLAYGLPAKAAEVWTCQGISEIAKTKWSFRFELSPPDLIETEYAGYPDKDQYRILENNEYGVVATHAQIGAPPQPEDEFQAPGGVLGYTIVINKKTGVFLYAASQLSNDKPDGPFFYDLISGKCQKD